MHYNDFHRFADDNRRRYVRQQQEQWRNEQQPEQRWQQEQWQQHGYNYRPEGHEPYNHHHHNQQQQWAEPHQRPYQSQNQFIEERFHQDDRQRNPHWPEDPYMRDPQSFHPDSGMYYNEHR